MKGKLTAGSLALAAAITVGASATAHAQGPVIHTQELNATGPWGPRCGGEAIIAHFTGSRRIEDFFDGATLVLERRHVTGDGTVMLPSTGKSLPYDFDFTLTLDFTAKTGIITGQQAHVVLPGGGGVIFRNSGRLLEDTTSFPPPITGESGQHDYFDPGGMDAVCAALGA